MATSTAHQESGKFDFRFGSDKFLPFEGAGLESAWKLYVTAPQDFDPVTISDVIVYVSYTARNG